MHTLQGKMPRICWTLHGPAMKALYYSIKLQYTGQVILWTERLGEHKHIASHIRELELDITVLTQGRPLQITACIGACPALVRLTCPVSTIPLVTDGLKSLHTLQLLCTFDRRNDLRHIQRFMSWSRHIPVVCFYAMTELQGDFLGVNFTQANLSADTMHFMHWRVKTGCEFNIGKFVKMLKQPPSSIFLYTCPMTQPAWQSFVDHASASTKFLRLDIARDYSLPDETWPEEVHIPGFISSDLLHFEQLDSLSLQMIGFREEDEILQIPETVKRLQITWHLSAWPFWEPLSKGLQACRALPPLELEAFENWAHTEADDDNDTLESLCRDFGAVTAISVLYALEGQSITPPNLSDWWLQHQERALPALLFRALVASCQEMIESLTEEPNDAE